MKIFVVFLAIFAVCYSVENNEEITDVDVKSEASVDWNVIDSESIPYEHGYRLKIKQDFNLEPVGLDKEDKEIIEHPCDFEDWKCIREFFAKNSDCTKSYGPIPDPLYLEINTVYYNYANLTATLHGLRVTGLSSIKVSEFYVNKDTGNVVLSLFFKNLNQSIPRVSFRYRRTGKESIVLNDYATALFTSGTFTAVIPKVPHLRLDKADIHADENDAVPPFFIAPNAANSTDPAVLSELAAFLADVPTAAREGLLLQADLFTALFIQKNICDFGLKLYST